MSKFFLNTYKIVRSILVGAIATVLSLYVILYILISLPSIQSKVKDIGEVELTKLLHTKVSIGSISISPFNQISANDVKVYDRGGNNYILTVDKLGASVSLYNLIINRRLVFTFAELIGMDAKLSKKDKNSPLNIQFIIDALNKKKPNSPPSKFDLSIYNIVIRKSRVSYDLLSEAPNNGKFDKNHIQIKNLTGDIVLPRLKNNDFIINVKRLAFDEKSGFRLKSMTFNSTITDRQIKVQNLSIELPNSLITPEEFEINFNSLSSLKKDLYTIPLNFTLSNSYITLSDLSAFVPKFNLFGQKLNITMAVNGTLSNLCFPVLNITSSNDRISVDISGNIYNVNDKKNLYLEFPHINLKANASEVYNVTAQLANLSPKIHDIISACGNINIDGSFNGSLSEMSFEGNTFTSIGNVAINAKVKNDTLRHIQSFKGSLITNQFKVGSLLNKSDILGDVSLNVSLDAIKDRLGIKGNVNGTINYLDFKNYRYNNIKADLAINRKEYKGSISMKDENIDFDLNGDALLDGVNSSYNLDAHINNLNLASLNLYKKYPDNNLSLSILANLSGNDIDNLDGLISLDKIKFINKSGEGIHLEKISLNAYNDSISRHIILHSDLINGSVDGIYNFKSLVPSIKRIVAQALPSLFPTPLVNNKNDELENDFIYSFNLEPNNVVLDFINSPIRLIHPITIKGNVNTINDQCNLIIDAPYLQQKDKVIENSSLSVQLDAVSNLYEVNLKTLYPNKKGNVSLNGQINASNNRIDSDFSWWMDRKSNFNGSVNLSTLLSKNENGKVDVSINVNPSDLVFNDTTWTVNPATIDIINNEITVKDFEVKCDKQFVKINGKASPNPEDQLIVDLEDINLNYIFQTLDIPNVSFGGRATGRFFASNVFTKIPTLSTPKLYVEGFSYNNSVLGNTNIESHWDAKTKGIIINANIHQYNNRTSHVNGEIYPTMDSLYIDFDTNKTPVGFLQPYMSAFTSKIGGYCSGKGTLFGNFKRLNFKGDIFAEDFQMKIDYLNTVYTCTDSIHIKPNLIALNSITLKDKFGNKALLNGVIKHDDFHDASFDISITNAKNFLCYDITPAINPVWHGTIFGNGSAFIKGEPGIVNIDVNMATADNSKFTFVMSDSEAAGDYSFITFLDRNKLVEVETDSVPETVRKLKEKKPVVQGNPTQVYINLQVEATPQAQMILVMDPVGGDKIKARGSGNLRMAYNSLDDEINILGKYTLEKGLYNFTLQDIIIKDFTIKEGSSITFNGDPMEAVLDISAIYSLNANLTDLDESFALDKELNRTNVPVHAVLNATGDISQPTISFDLEFPTLTQEAYQKIKSIISTEDMMNRQIIYLIALNRFYTPEYMGQTNNNSEFANVASSTISSQLSNMLGQISENWTIAPNFRTNKGNFSDVEVDLALSSQLLNNRLLLNGNFGYRDKALNNSSNFIGDFDIEYLLSKSGNIRLKAYNRYNDQNYYIKSALTTQGVGIVFKHEFDNMFDFLRKKKKRNSYLLKPFDPDSVNTQQIQHIDSIKK